jgi:hypothetical protein
MLTHDICPDLKLLRYDRRDRCLLYDVLWNNKKRYDNLYLPRPMLTSVNLRKNPSAQHVTRMP